MGKDVLAKPDAFLDVFERKPDADKRNTTYCPGCGHGILHKLIGEAVSDLGIIDRTTIIAPVGCAVFMYYYYKCNGIQAAHGRAPAVGTGIIRAQPDSIVISYQGDGDLAAIGANNIIQAANRGERIAVIFVNNAVYGMTGGQMAPTTLLGMPTTTTPRGRTAENDGYPMRMCELIATLDAPVYVARVSLAGTKEIMRARGAIRRALQVQVDRKGFAFVEVLSQCPERWKVDPAEADAWIRERMHPVFPVRVFKDTTDAAPSRPAERRDLSPGELLALLGVEEDGKSAAPKKPLASGAISYRFAGSGGQGVLTLGAVVAQAGLAAGYQAVWLPSYGPEMRGGTANSSVILRDGPIGSPLVDRPDVLVAMNAQSVEAFLPTVREGGLVLYNSSIVASVAEAPAGVKVHAVPALDLARRVGEPRTANIVMLGAYNALTGMFEPQDLERALRVQFSKGLDANLRALAAGEACVKERTKAEG